MNSKSTKTRVVVVFLLVADILLRRRWRSTWYGGRHNGDTWEYECDVAEVEEHSYCLECEDFSEDDDERGKHYAMVHRERFCDVKGCEELLDSAEELARHRSEEHRRQGCCGTGSIPDENSQVNGQPFQSVQIAKLLGLQPRKGVPLNNSCGYRMKHVSRAAVILHLEAGACPNGMSLRQLNQLILEHDKTQMFIKVRDVEHINASPASIQQHECRGNHWICMKCGKTYSSQRTLEKHVQSAIHLQKAWVVGGSYGGASWRWVSISRARNAMCTKP